MHKISIAVIFIATSLAVPAVSIAQRLYEATNHDNTVSLIDTSVSPPVVGPSVAVGPPPFNVATSPDGKLMYVADFGSGTVDIVNAAASPPAHE